MNHTHTVLHHACLSFVSVHQMAPPLTEVRDIQLQLTTHRSILKKGWKAELKVRLCADKALECEFFTTPVVRCGCRRLDYERQTVYHVTATARDWAVRRPLSSSVNITINVVDVDDCRPTFERPLYRAHVSVDCPIGHEVTSLIRASIYNNRIVKMSRHERGLRGRTDGRARQARVAGGERTPAAGRNRGIGRRRASQNRDVTPEAWLPRTDGRAGGYTQSRRRAAWRLATLKRRRVRGDETMAISVLSFYRLRDAERVTAAAMLYDWG